MSLLDCLKNLFSKPQTPAQPSQSVSSTKKLSYAEKELLAVRRTTLADVQQLSGFPFKWNHRLEKSIQPHGHPFAYMDIVGENISITLSELEKMNLQIEHSKTLCKEIPTSLRIPTSDIVFTKSAIDGYSRLILSPITHDGEPAKIPVCLTFTTDPARKDTTHGDIHYSAAGTVEKAELYFWRRNAGYHFYFDAIDSALVLSRIEKTVTSAGGGNSTVIYKGAHILEFEANLAKTEQDFAWLQTHLPEQCPKSISGYRRMKTQNTKNFQALRALAMEQGREI